MHQTHAGLRLMGLLLAWLAGAALQLHQPALWAGSSYLGGLALAVLLVGLGWRWRRAWVVSLLGLGVLAFALTGLRAVDRLSEQLPPELEGQDVLITGVGRRRPRPASDGVQFQFRVESAQWQGQPVALPSSVSLGWYSRAEEASPQAPHQALRAGQRWRLPARLKRPHGNANPRGFDYELWLFDQGIRATGTVRAGAAAPAQLLDMAAGYPVERLRLHTRVGVQQRVSDTRIAGVLAALAVGDQAAIDRPDWDLFRATGIAHLMSISGLHVTMFAWIAAAAIGWLWRRSDRLMLGCATPLAARWGGVVAATGYAWLAGWGVPAQRTIWMLASAALLSSLGLRWPWTLVLALAAAVVAAIDPWAMLQPGFWLSFAAVGLLLASEPASASASALDKPAGRLRSLVRLLHGGLRTQVVATLGLAPLTLLFFQQVSLVGFIANLAAIPLVTLVVTPLALLGLVVPVLWTLAAAVVQVLVGALAWLAAWPGAVWFAAAPAWAQATGLLGGALLVMPLPWRVRGLGLILMLPLLLPAPLRPDPGRFELLAADVGQGSAVLVRTRSHLLLYDAGPQYSRDSDAGQRVLLPLLRARGEQAVDLLMLSHRDSDHTGGAAALLDNFAVRAIATSINDDEPLGHVERPRTRCAAGQQWFWDGVRFDVLHPDPRASAASTKTNARSCVVRVQDARGRSVLLTGDIERPQEESLVATQGAALRSDILLVPHHGSRSSSSSGFLTAVRPSLAVVQAGYRNRYGHPAPDVMARYDAAGITVVRSDDCGAWTWRGADAGSCERKTNPRYWHTGRPPPLAASQQ